MWGAKFCIFTRLTPGSCSQLARLDQIGTHNRTTIRHTCAWCVSKVALSASLVVLRVVLASPIFDFVSGAYPSKRRLQRLLFRFVAMASRLVLALSIFLFQLPTSTSSSDSGILALYTDLSCNNESPINPTTDLSTNTCLVTPGAFGIAVDGNPPACASGYATLVMYEDTSCVANLGSTGAIDNCYENVEGVSAVMFVCEDNSGGSSATATSTVSAGSASTSVAAGAAATAAATSASAVPSDQAAWPSSNAAATPTSAPPASSNDLQSGSSDSSDISRGVRSSTSARAKRNRKIILGVVLPVAGLALAALAKVFHSKRKGKRGGDAEQDRYQTMQTPSQHGIPVQVSTPPAAGWSPNGNVAYQQYPHPSLDKSGPTVTEQGYGRAM